MMECNQYVGTMRTHISCCMVIVLLAMVGMGCGGELSKIDQLEQQIEASKDRERKEYSANEAKAREAEKIEAELMRKPDWTMEDSVLFWEQRDIQFTMRLQTEELILTERQLREDLQEQLAQEYLKLDSLNR